MLDASKDAMNAWISENLMNSADPHGAIHDAGNGDGTIQADGYLDLAELVEMIEQVTREDFGCPS
jgi:hypothetical protein